MKRGQTPKGCLGSGTDVEAAIAIGELLDIFGLPVIRRGVMNGDVTKRGYSQQDLLAAVEAVADETHFCPKPVSTVATGRPGM